MNGMILEMIESSEVSETDSSNDEGGWSHEELSAFVDFNDSEKHLPIPVTTNSTPFNPHHFITHVLLSLRKYYELGETVRRAFSPFAFSRRYFSLNGLLFRKIKSHTEVETVSPARARSSFGVVFVPPFERTMTCRDGRKFWQCLLEKV